jgi:MFS family permease
VAAVIYVLMVALLAQASNLLVLIVFAGLYGAAKGAFDVAVNAQAITVEKQYGSPIMSFFQGCWSAGGLLGAGAASLMLQQRRVCSRRSLTHRRHAHPVQPLGNAIAYR